MIFYTAKHFLQWHWLGLWKALKFELNCHKNPHTFILQVFFVPMLFLSLPNNQVSPKKDTLLTWLDAKLERVTLVASWQWKKKVLPLGSFSGTCSVLLYLFFSHILPHTYYIRIVFNSADVWQNALGKSTTDSSAVCLRIYFWHWKKSAMQSSHLICFSNRLFFNSFTTKYILVH